MGLILIWREFLVWNRVLLIQLAFLQMNLLLMIRYLIDENGNVGIGTTSPDAKLHISDSGNSTLKIVSTNATSPNIELYRTSLNNSSHHDSSLYNDPWTDWKIYNNNSKLEFQAGYRTATSGNHLSSSPQTLVTAMSINGRW